MNGQDHSESTSTASQALNHDQIARYLNGAPPESEQFDFFVGEWNCDLHLHGAGVDPAPRFRGKWTAKWLHDRRILLDDLSVFLPSGEEILSWINLRTYCADSGHWEITGQRTLEPASGALTTGRWQEGEMRLVFETHQEGRSLAHRVRFHEITPDSFEWEWDQKLSSGADWQAFTSLTARRA